MSLALTYYKRYRMEIDLRGRDFSHYSVPAGYRMIPWDLSTHEQHAEVKYRSFREEIDSQVFPCLSNYDGCLRLMREIGRKSGFCPDATWLIVRDVHRLFNTGKLDCCGTIQGVVDGARLGSIQNIGVLPNYRGKGLGAVLLARALQGFRLAGIQRAYLEVTSQNDAAVRLYRRLGFTKARTLYKVIEESCS